MATMPADLTREQILNTVSWMARGRRFDRVVALDEFDHGDCGSDSRAHAHSWHGHEHHGLLSRQAGHAHEARRSRDSWCRSSAGC